MKNEIEKDFVFEFSDSCGDFKLTAPMQIPLRISAKEYSCRLINAFQLPCYIEKQLLSSLENFIKKETDEFYTTQAELAVKSLQNGDEGDTDVKLKSMANSWCRAFREEHASFATPEVITNETVFSEVYHIMVHLGALDTLMNLEHSYSVAMEDLLKERDEDVDGLQSKQSEDMEFAVQNVGVSMSDDQVNALAARHFEETQLLQSKWASELNALCDTQKRTFIDCVMRMHEDYQINGRLPVQGRLRSMTDTSSHNGIGLTSLPPQQPSRMEESFTIHLGAQMKQTHNLRLVATDALSFCWQRATAEGGILPQRLQTAMSLYSSNLCGLVLLVDKRVNSYSGIKRDFASICQRTSEFHFADLDDQFESIRQEQSSLSHWRISAASAKLDADTTSVNSGESESSGSRAASLNTGDFYVTHHSGLSEVHVVFHLAVDDSVHSGDITSRHPVILGLRNVLKVACMCDISTLTLPLFLVHEMLEEMTMSWCLKRAELIFKCIKGFMMEMASWGGHESRTVQFLVPRGISEELFATLATMLPSIFRMSNPLVVKS